MKDIILETRVDRLAVRVFRSRAAMGEAAAADCAEAFRGVIASSGGCRAMFAAAPSQNEVLAGLVAAGGIDWTRVEAFHLDEYLGLPRGARQAFGAFLEGHIFGKLPFGAVHYIADELSRFGGDYGAAAKSYAELVSEAPMDIICLGVGENGHIAFNDPLVADFHDPLLAKRVELDQACRRQQVNDRCFDDLASVPTHAITLTIPALVSGRRLFCVVPGRTKAAAIARMLNGPIDESCPATILRRHGDCALYLDQDSASAWLESADREPPRGY